LGPLEQSRQLPLSDPHGLAQGRPVSLRPVTSTFLTRVTSSASSVAWVSSWVDPCLVAAVLHLALVLQRLDLLPEHFDRVALHLPQLPLLLEGGPGVAELLAELLGVRLQPHVPQLLLHLPHLRVPGSCTVASPASLHCSRACLSLLLNLPPASCMGWCGKSAASWSRNHRLRCSPRCSSSTARAKSC